MGKRITSRLAKKQRKQLVRQSFFFIVGGLALCALFLFFIMPKSINLLFNLIDNGDVIDVKDDFIPPQIPILQQVPEATFTSSLKLSGYAESGSDVIIKNNDKKVDDLLVPDNGKFEYKLKLNKGENFVSIYSIDPAGNESVSSRDYIITYDNEPPKIEIDEPKDGETIELKRNRVTTIRGKTEPKSKVFINQRLVYPNEDGEFYSSYPLKEGDNELLIRVVDQAGNSSELEMTVYFRH